MADTWDGVTWNEGDFSNTNFGFWSHHTFVSPSCGNVTVGYYIRLPNTWYTAPSRKFPVVYWHIPNWSENWMWTGSVGPTQGGGPSGGDIGPAKLNWDPNAASPSLGVKCVLVTCNTTLYSLGMDATPTSPQFNIMMMQQQMRELIDAVELGVLGSRSVPQGWSDPNGRKGRGIFGVSGGGNTTWRLGGKHPDKYAALYTFASATVGDHTPWPQAQFPQDSQMFDPTTTGVNGQATWLTYLPLNIIPTFAAQMISNGLWVHGQVCSGDTGNVLHNTRIFDALAANGVNHDPLDIPNNPDHTAYAYITPPLPWLISKFLLSPSPNPGSYSTPLNTLLTIAGSTLVANDTDPQLLTLSVASVQSPANGAVALSGGVVTFTPTSGYIGPASFDYTVTNTDGWTASATVSVSVTAGSQTGFWNDAGVWVDTGTWIDGGSAPINLVDSSPIIGAPALISFSGGVTLFAYILDHGLSALSLADKLHVCPSMPADYAGVLSLSLGSKTLGAGGTFGVPTPAPPSGRQAVSTPVINGVITGNGSVAYWAAVDSVNSRLLASGTVSGGRAVTSGQIFTLSSVTVQLPKV